MADTGKQSGKELTQGKLLFKNSLWNTLGLVLPLIVGVFAMPMLIEGLGTQRFGTLTIVWMVIGYFSIFDFGLGRALTKLIAERLGQDRESELPSLFWTAISMMTVAGMIGALVVAGLAKHIVYEWLNIAPELEAEVLQAFYLLSLSIPVVILTTGFRGVLEAYQKFAVINIIRIPLGLLTFIGPLLVLPFSNSLYVIVAVLLAGRILGAFAYYRYCMLTASEFRRHISIQRQHIRPLLSFGGWMTAANLIGPMMVYLDRFLIGSILGMSAVAYYVAPYEMVTKLWMIPMGLIGVLFPAFSTLLHSDKERAIEYFSRGSKFILFSMFPIFLVINLFAYEGLNLWLGKEFAENGAILTQWLSIGVFLNCVGRMPYILVQSAGRPDLITKLFLLELIPYIGALWYALNNYGIEGAAFVWMIRVLIDTVILFYFSSLLVPDTKRLYKSILMLLFGAISLLGGVMLMDTFLNKLVLGSFLILASAIYIWNSVLAETEKNIILNKVFSRGVE